MLTRALLHSKLLGRQIARQRLRFALTTGGIAIGVASVLSILAINRSTYAAFRSAVESVAGAATIEIANGAAGVPDGIIGDIEAIEGVEAAAGVVQEFVRIPSLDNRQIAVFGVDLIQQSPIWEQDFSREGFDLERELDVITEATAIVMSDKLAREGGYAYGDELVVTGPGGRKTLKVRGTFTNQRFANIFQGDVVVMDILPAQISFAKEGRFDWISVKTSGAASDDTVREKIARYLAGRGEVTSPAMRGRRVESMLFVNRWLLTCSSLFAMTVGLFLISHSMYTSVRQRSGQLATLRCLGATRSDLALAIAGEAGVAGLLGVILGTIAGILTCHFAVGPFGAFVSATYAQVRTADVVVAPLDILVAAGIACTAIVGGGILPLLTAITTDPIRGVERYASGRVTRSWITMVVGSVLVVLGIALPSLRVTRTWFVAQTALAVGSAVLLLVGTAFLAPVLVRMASAILEPLLRRSWGGVGTWLWEQVARGGERTALTIASLTGGFAFAVFMAVVLVSYKTAVVEYLETSFPADLIVSVGPGLSLLSGPTASIAAGEEIARIPGVIEMLPARFVEVSFGDAPIIVQGLGDGLFEKRYGDSAPEIERGEVVISDTLMERHGLDVGDRFSLPTPTGPIELIVAKVEPDYLLDLGSVKIPWSVFSERWNESRANWFMLTLASSASASDVKAAIDRDVGGRYDLTVLSRKDTRAAIDLLISATFALMFLCELLAVAVAVMAVMNGIAASMLDRARQLRLLRTLGLTPKASRRLMATEGATLGLLGGVFGVSVGSIAVYRFLTASIRHVAGFHIDVVWPIGTVLTLLVFGAFVGMVTGYFASRRADTGALGSA